MKLVNKRIEITRRWLEEGARSTYWQDESRSLSDLSALPLYILKGAAGTGKTDAVKDYVNGNSSRRKRRLFEEITSCSVVESWLRQAISEDHELFLDALDEHHSSFKFSHLFDPIEAVSGELGFPRLRVVSRSLHLPDNFAERLASSAGVERCKDYRLLPLSSKEIEHWIHLRLGSRSEEFIQEIRKNGLGEDLSRPADLEEFLNAFAAEGCLGNSRSEAWLKSVRVSLNETNFDKRSSIVTEDGSFFDVYEKTKCAGFLAVIDSASQKFPLILGKGLRFERGITVSEFIETYREFEPGLSAAECRKLLSDTVDTRLFDRSGNIITFVSAMKSQFLAANFLRDISPQDIISLIKDRVSGNSVAAPARVIGAELAGFHEEVFNWICENDPESLLYALGSEFSFEQRAKIVDALFNNLDRDYRPHYGLALSSLSHPNIEKQLKPYLLGKELKSWTRFLAIDLADYCNCQELSHELGVLATDANNSEEIRTCAARCLVDLGPSGRDYLRRLFITTPAEDPADNLYGTALRGLWPNEVGDRPVFSLLRPPRIPSSGAYHSFLTYQVGGVCDRLVPNMLEGALVWLLRQQTVGRLHIEDFQPLSVKITKLAWQNLDLPSVSAHLLRIMRARCKRRKSILPFKGNLHFDRDVDGLTAEEFSANVEARRTLLKELTQQSSNVIDGHFTTILGTLAFQDEVWLIDHLKDTPENLQDSIRSCVKSAIVRYIEDEDESRISELNAGCRNQGIDIHAIRLEYEMYRKLREAGPRPKRNFRLESSCKDVADILRNRGDVGAYATCQEELAKNDRGSRDISSWNIQVWPGWERLSAEERKLFLLWSKDLVLHGVPDSAGDDLSYQDSCLIVGLKFIAEIDWEWCVEHSNSLVAWLGKIVTRLRWSDPEEVLNRLVKLQQPRLIATQILHALDSSEDFGESPLNVFSFSSIWREEVGVALERILLGPTISARTRDRVLGILILNNYSRRSSILLNELNSDQADRQKLALEFVFKFRLIDLYAESSAIAADKALLFDHVWHLLWDEPRPHSVRLDGCTGKFLRLLVDRAIREELPPEPRRFGAYSPTVEDERRSIRIDFVEVLARTNEQESWEFLIERSGISGCEWLAKIARTARKEFVANSWSPPSPKDILRLKVSQNARYLATAEDLLDATCFALEKIRPVVENLGACWIDDSYKMPAHETKITEMVANFLRYELSNKFIVNMEVKCSFGGRTDIQVEASSLDASQRLQCIVEAKKSTNRELVEGIPLQLRAKYLSGNLNSSGVYLVLRFAGKYYEDSDWNEIAARLSLQAEAVDRPLKIISYKMGLR